MKRRLTVLASALKIGADGLGAGDRMQMERSLGAGRTERRACGRYASVAITNRRAMAFPRTRMAAVQLDALHGLVERAGEPRHLRAGQAHGLLEVTNRLRQRLIRMCQNVLDGLLAQAKLFRGLRLISEGPDAGATLACHARGREGRQSPSEDKHRSPPPVARAALSMAPARSYSMASGGRPLLETPEWCVRSLVLHRIRHSSGVAHFHTRRQWELASLIHATRRIQHDFRRHP